MSELKLNASSSNFSLTESHREKMKFQMEVIRASEIDNSHVINKLAENSQISQNNSIWNSNLHVVTQRNTLRQEGTESKIK
jgi:16S rRNA G527 N7-methylase RsmG